jgi:hypothetical protein
VSCLGNDGQITANITGGTNNVQPYLTLWTNSNIPPDTLNNQFTNNYDITISSLPVGTYHLSVLDDNGCSLSNSVSLAATPVVTVTAAATAINCFGGSSIITASATGGDGNKVITIGGLPIASNYPAGTYTVIATATLGGCTRQMTGTVSVATFNCTVAISDPCVCLNNSTTLFDGQFGEQIKVNAPSTQIWTITAINGLYSTGSPAPPSAPIALPVGTALVNIGGNMFTLDGRHVDAIGYTITVNNALGTSLSIGNSCQYPNPVITTDLNADFCLFSDVVNLTGDPGDANIVSQGFTVDGVPATQFNAGALGIGQHKVVYTVNGGVPKAFGPNDPGCIQSVSVFVNVIVTPTNVTCNDLVYLSLDADCTEEILPDDILEGTYGCFDDYLVELD